MIYKALIQGPSSLRSGPSLSSYVVGRLRGATEAIGGDPASSLYMSARSDGVRSMSKCKPRRTSDPSGARVFLRHPRVKLCSYRYSRFRTTIGAKTDGRRLCRRRPQKRLDQSDGSLVELKTSTMMSQSEWRGLHPLLLLVTCYVRLRSLSGFHAIRSVTTMPSRGSLEF